MLEWLTSAARLTRDERARAWNFARPETKDERRKRWRREDRFRWAVNEANKRARPQPPIKPVDALNRVAEYGALCIYCLAPFKHMDHVEPLGLGGAHHIDNFVPACAGCNLSKGKKPLLAWLATREPSKRKQAK